RGYLMATDPKLVNRTWQEVMVSKADTTTGDTRKRWDVAINDKAFDLIRHLPLVETTSDHLLRVLKAGTVSTNAYLRKIHNFAVNMDWLLKPVIPRREWPTLKYRLRRAITVQEHRKIIER